MTEQSNRQAAQAMPDDGEIKTLKEDIDYEYLADDIAKTMLFVVSDDAAMITGSMITVDGGAAMS